MYGISEIRKINNQAATEADAAVTTHFIDTPGGIAISVRDKDGDIQKGLITGAIAAKFRKELANHDGRIKLVNYRQQVCRKYVKLG
jgi:hypothetical protein